MPHKFNAARRHKFDKVQYRVINWAEYNESLRQRGDLTIWVSEEAQSVWSAPRRTSRGGQRRYSDLAIETCLMLRTAYHLGLRQTQGLMGSIGTLMGLDIRVPDYSTLSRRANGVSIAQVMRQAGSVPIHLVVDSTGLKIFGEGEWLAQKHNTKGIRRRWRKRFATTTRKNIEFEQLRAAVRMQLDTLVRANPNRADFLTKFEALIESYNAGSRNIDELFHDLLSLSRSLSDEEQRHVRERLTEEELTVFDLLTRPGPDLTSAERDEVKKVARHLLQRVRGALVLNWRQKSQARARVRLAIEDTLDEGLPRSFTPEIYQGKVAVLFEHVFETFREATNAGASL